MSNIENKLEELNESISDLENKISSSLNNLKYVTDNSFKELNRNVTLELKNIGSSVDFNNLLSSIQVYQNQKLNTNVKRLNSRK